MGDRCSMILWCPSSKVETFTDLNFYPGDEMFGVSKLYGDEINYALGGQEPKGFPWIGINSAGDNYAAGIQVSRPLPSEVHEWHESDDWILKVDHPMGDVSPTRQRSTQAFITLVMETLSQLLEDFTADDCDRHADVLEGFFGHDFPLKALQRHLHVPS